MASSRGFDADGDAREDPFDGVGDAGDVLIHGSVEVSEGSGERVGGDWGEAEFVGYAEDLGGAFFESATEVFDVGHGRLGGLGGEDSRQPES
jgi:hypothetical protein